jgi:hypothetical protein
MKFQIDLSKLGLDRTDYKKIGECAILELSKKIGKEVTELSLDHFYDMGDFGGDENLHVLEISYDLLPDDFGGLVTYVFKEIDDLNFNVYLEL